MHPAPPAHPMNDARPHAPHEGCTHQSISTRLENGSTRQTPCRIRRAANPMQNPPGGEPQGDSAPDGTPWTGHTPADPMTVHTPRGPLTLYGLSKNPGSARAQLARNT